MATGSATAAAAGGHREGGPGRTKGQGRDAKQTKALEKCSRLSFLWLTNAALSQMGAADYSALHLLLLPHPARLYLYRHHLAAAVGGAVWV